MKSPSCRDNDLPAIAADCKAMETTSSVGTDISSEYERSAEEEFPYRQNVKEPNLHPSLAAVSAAANIDSLSDELHLKILEFIDTDSVRSMMQVSHHFRSLIASKEAESLWWEACHRRWNWIDQNRRIVDDFHLPTQCVVRSERANLSLLLSLSSQKKSTGVDSSFIHSRRRLIKLEGNDAIQYTGVVGEGDRCIRADQPLPHPEALTRRQRRQATKAVSKKRSFFDRLFHPRLPKEARPCWRPFVAPFISHEEEHVTPRLISYYEISILPAPEPAESDRRPFRNFLEEESVGGSGAECVAVGLATSSFRLVHRMPGWDPTSYGYHGDDGGAFHGEGHMVRQFGPRFGAGDTVGCGIDYQKRSIFYTLNGEFLGYAFEALSRKELQEDFYPVIGVDTNCPIVCNFGCHEEFQFDLNAMICRQRDVILQSMMMLV